MQLLVNHLGYEKKGSKIAILTTQDDIQASHAELICQNSGRVIQQLQMLPTGTIDEWHTGFSYLIDFSELTTTGQFRLRFEQCESFPFEVKEQILFEKTFSDMIHYFKSQRASGDFDEHDKKAKLFGQNQTVDVRGGWYDASGDVSKYLSHLSYANYLNPQQIPMVCWHFLSALSKLDLPKFTQTRLKDEAKHGVDFLLRMQNKAGFFYTTVFDQWSKDPSQREICAYETQAGHKTADYHAGFRQGGGIAIAALALASKIQLASDTKQNDAYQNAAEKGYWHLKSHNLDYLDDGCENIIDFYCALLATTELYKLTASEAYLEEARIWASRLSEQQQTDAHVTNFWSANGDGSRPYYHASDAGLPVIALMEYLSIESDSSKIEKYQQIICNSVRFELTITNAVNNPFGYPRQYIKNIDDEKRSSFFIAQRNESGYWWQGENARIASLAAMAFQAADFINDLSLQLQLIRYGQQNLNWILGLNPFDICMLDGHGHNNPDYLPSLGFHNAKGGICNGITAGFENERDIAFNPANQRDDMLQNWRWGEQWIPHAAWYFYAIAMHKRYVS